MNKNDDSNGTKIEEESFYPKEKINLLDSVILESLLDTHSDECESDSTSFVSHVGDITIDQQNLPIENDFEIFNHHTNIVSPTFHPTDITNTTISSAATDLSQRMIAQTLRMRQTMFRHVYEGKVSEERFNQDYYCNNTILSHTPASANISTCNYGDVVDDHTSNILCFMKRQPSPPSSG